MAVYVQPYNTWKEQAALSLLGGFIDKLQQTEQNRKTNAFRGQLQQNLAAQTGANDNISLMPQNEPQGYNDNPWASAFHKTDNPLTQFNIGTAGSQSRLPTMSEIANMGASLAGSKRFSGMNPDTVQKIIAEMSQANEAQRMNDLRSQYANQFGEAGSFGDQVKAIMGLAMQGGVDYRAAGDFAQFNRPRPYLQSTIDAGDRVIPISFDQDTGKTTFLPNFMKGVNPDTVHEATSRENVANIAAGAQYAAADAAKSEWDFKRIQEALKIEQDNLEQAINDYQSMNFQNDEQRQAFYDSRIAPIKQRIEAYQSALIQGVSAYGAGGGQTSFGGAVNDGGKWDSLVNTYAEKRNLDPDLIHAVIHIESGGDHKAVSEKDARGLMQLMEATAKRFGVEDRYNPEQNIAGGTAYLKWLLDRYNGNVEKALQAYHCGEGNVDKGTVPEISKRYAKNVLAIFNKRKSARAKSQGNPTTVTNLGKTDTPTAQNTQNTGNQSTTTPKNSPNPSSNNSGGVFAGWGDTDNAPAYVNSEGEYITNSEYKYLEQKYGTKETMRQLEARGFYPPETADFGSSLPTEQQQQTTEQTTQPQQQTTQTATQNTENAQNIPQVIPMSANSSGSQSLASAPFAARFVSSQPMHTKPMQGEWTVGDIADYIKSLYKPEITTSSANEANPFSSMIPGSNIIASPPNNPALQAAGDADAQRNMMDFSEAVNYVKSLFNRNSTQNNFTPYVPLHMHQDFPANPTSVIPYSQSFNYSISLLWPYLTDEQKSQLLQGSLTQQMLNPQIYPLNLRR